MDESGNQSDLTREVCDRCHEISPIGFYSPIWERVAGKRWKWSILCIMCFARLGDEKMIRWEQGLEFYPVSFATHRDFVLSPDT